MPFKWSYPVTTGNRLFFLLIAALLAVGLFFFLFPNQEKEVKKQLNRLSRYASKQQDEPTLTSLTKSARIGKLFADTCILKINNPRIEGSFSPKEIMDRITMARNAFADLNVSFYDIDIQFPAKTTAEAVLTMRLLGKLGHEDFADVQEVRFNLKKTERKWLINGVEFIEVLER